MSNLKVSSLAHRTGSGNVSVQTGNAIVGTDVGSVRAPGSVIQVATSLSGPTRYTFTTTTPQVIPGLSITFTPKFANSLILVEGVISGTQTHVNSYGVFKDGAATVSTSGVTNNNEPNMHVTQYMGANTTDWIYQIPIMHYETSGSTTARTYAIYVTSGWGGTAYTTYVNNRASNEMASFSHMKVTEIAQ